ncbi:nucleotidyltransferase family protein [Candidatus Woesearchaeota archaeon]|nr:nucleotidyltransferase family protein [Candidatus Woesearchaeota archaeon]
MKDLKQIQSILSKHKEELRETYNVKEIGVFGSYARGEQKKSSDIDILVEFEESIGFFKFLEMEERIGKILGVKVDLVTKNALKPRIGQHILKEVVAI